MNKDTPGPKRGRIKGSGTRGQIVTIRMSPELFAAAGLTAQVTLRSVSSLVEYATKLYIRKNYPAAMLPGARVTLSLTEAPVEGTAA